MKGLTREELLLAAAVAENYPRGCGMRWVRTIPLVTVNGLDNLCKTIIADNSLIALG